MTRAAKIGGAEPESKQVAPGTSYGLGHPHRAQFIAYGQREYGINLVWAGADNPLNITIATIDSSPLEIGERFSLRVRGGGYLRYGKRSKGINLVWSRTVAPEWELRSDAGGPARSGRSVYLYNTVAQAFVKYENRRWGINLGWSDCR